MDRPRIVPRILAVAATIVDAVAWVVLFATSDSKWLWICWVAALVGIAAAATGAASEQPRITTWSVFVVITALLLVVMVGLSS